MKTKILQSMVSNFNPLPALLALGAIGLGGCAFHSAKQGADTAGQAGTVAKVSYALVQQKVFAQSCTGCHDSKGIADLKDYPSVKADIANIDRRVFVEKSMPQQGSLTGDQLALLRAWIDAGAPEQEVLLGGAPNPAPAAETPPTIEIADLSFNNINTKIFQAQCTKCHQGDGIDFRTEASIRDNLPKIAVAALVNKNMPPNRTDPSKQGLSLADRTLLQAWLSAGAPSVSPASLELQPTYTSLRKAIFEPLCINCHGTGHIAADKPLAPYSAIIDPEKKMAVPKDSAHSGILEAVSAPAGKRMPPKSMHWGALPQPMIDAIKAWIDAGSPEN
jgi:mono/diheme cytochrome c family protein